METIDLLEQGFAFTRVRLVGVQPRQLDDPTPCADWDVRSLINHAVNAAATAAGVLTGEDEGDPWSRSADEMAERNCGDDPVAAYDSATQAIVEASRGGALEQLFFLHQMQLPGAVLANGAAFDAVVHGWDLARATGQDATIPDEIAEQLLAAASAIPDESRSLAFGPAIVVAPTASPTDQLVALLGRQP